MNATRHNRCSRDPALVVWRARLDAIGAFMSGAEEIDLPPCAHRQLIGTNGDTHHLIEVMKSEVQLPRVAPDH